MNSVNNSSLRVNQETYDIRKREHLLTKSSSGKYFCPACGGNDFSISKDTGAYGCYSSKNPRGECTPEDIRSAIDKLEGKPEFTASKKAPFVQRKPSLKVKKPKIRLSSTIERVESVPLPGRVITSTQYGCTHTIKHKYSNTQWVERVEAYDHQGQRVNKLHNEKSKTTFPYVKGSSHPTKGNKFWSAYKLQEALNANTNYIVLVEGEDCVDHSWLLGIPAITFQGASWTDEEIKLALKLIKDAGKVLIIIPDNDKTGRDKVKLNIKACNDPAIALQYAIFELKTLWPEAPDKADVVNWIKMKQQEGLSIDQIGKILCDAIIEGINSDYEPDWAIFDEQPLQNVENQLNLNDELETLLSQSLTDSDLRFKFIELSKTHGTPVSEVEKFYTVKRKEIDQAESVEDVKNDLDKILDASASTVPLEKVLPSELARPINQLAKWLNIKPEVYLTALLTGISSLHHPKTNVCLKKEWGFYVSPNLYGGIVADPSQKKTPVLKTMIVLPMNTLQSKARDDYRRELMDYQTQLNCYEEEKKKRNNDLTEKYPEGRPTEPKQKIFFMDNATHEGIFNQASDFPDQGLLFLKDELAGLFKSANQYRSGRGSDEEDLLSLYDSQSISILRASKKIYIDSLLLSIFGSIQPGVLQKMLGDQTDDNGKWSRFIFVYQPNAESQMKDEDVNFDLSPILEDIYQKFANQSQTQKSYVLDKSAKSLFCKAYNEFERLRVENAGTPIAHVYGKSEGRIGKIAINLHVLKHIFLGSHDIPETIDAETVSSAILLTRFYIQQIEGLYTALDSSESNITTQLAKVLEIAKNGNWIATRDVTQKLSKSDRARFNGDRIKQWFKQLEAMGKGVTEESGRSIKFKINVGNVGQCWSNVGQSTNVENPSNINVSSSLDTNVGNVGQFFTSSTHIENFEEKKQTIANKPTLNKKSSENLAAQSVDNVGTSTNIEPTLTNITNNELQTDTQKPVTPVSNPLQSDVPVTSIHSNGLSDSAPKPKVFTDLKIGKYKGNSKIGRPAGDVLIIKEEENWFSIRYLESSEEDTFWISKSEIMQ